MRYISFWLLFVALFFTNLGCKTPVPAVTSEPPKIAYTISTNQVLTMLEASARLNIFDVVRTNALSRVDFTNAIAVLNDRIATTNCDTITLKSTLLHQSPIVYSNLVSTLNLLEYYTKTHTNCLEGLQAIKTGIEKGLGK